MASAGPSLLRQIKQAATEAATIPTMSGIAGELTTLGMMLVLALSVEALGRHTRLPRVSLLIMLGLILGPAALGLVVPGSNGNFEFISAIALAMVGFLVGGKLSRRLFRRLGGLIFWLSLTEVAVTFAVVAAGLLLLGWPLALCLLLAAIATATDPAATLETIRESGKDTRFSDTLTGIVAIDDAWGIILFSLVVLVLSAMEAPAIDLMVIGEAGGELLGAVGLGLAIGLPMALLSGRVRKGEPTLMEAMGMVMICCGLAHHLGVSHLLASVTLGATVANFARHHHRPFHAIEEIEWPFLALFFIFCGAHLNVGAVVHAGALLVAYLLLRSLGRLLGGWLGALPRRVDSAQARAIGLAMLPQAGVAMAMALLAASYYPEYGDALVATVTAATVLFELIGPLAAREVLARQADAD
jgi:Kef-type K+ transport system membrane component KefB